MGTKKLIIPIVLGIGAIGGLAYFLLKKKPEVTPTTTVPIEVIPTPPTAPTPTPTPPPTPTPTPTPPELVIEAELSMEAA